MGTRDVVYAIVDHLAELDTTNLVPSITLRWLYKSRERRKLRALRRLRKRQKVPELPRSPYPQFSMFVLLFSNPARRELLRHISIEATTTFPLEEKHKEKSIEGFLSRAVSLVFQELHEWEADVKDEKLRPKTLEINCASHRDLWAERPCNEILIPGLHTVRSIKKLASGSGNGPDYYTLPLRLAVKTPNLEALEVAFVPLGTSDGPDERRQHQALAEALDGLRGQGVCPALRELRIRRYPWWRVPLGTEETFLGRRDGLDPVCEAIRLLAQHKKLETLHLSGMILSRDLFRDLRTPTNLTWWASLRQLVIDCYAMAPLEPTAKDQVCDLFSLAADGKGVMIPQTFDPLVRDILSVGSPMLELDDLLDDNGHRRWQFQSQHAQWNPLPQDLSTSVQIVQG
ncbi:hypothetical protein CPLU01_11725 [Colletotrichum plurivorum]|uniref:Uncharacterized protein n=1 Tax=Colletotrichum plurivorum TaxID=2175906 RepID=A0A8H6N7B6_9PEZI|nr:hypothetical protein CPLU01_11725 [Colletotrichum plurivorum]